MKSPRTTVGCGFSLALIVVLAGIPYRCLLLRGHLWFPEEWQEELMREQSV